MGLNTGALYILIIMGILFALAWGVTGPAPAQSPILTGPESVPFAAGKKDAQKELQLLYFGGATITPPASSVCNKGGINARPEIIIGNTPKHGTAVPSNGWIKVWATDADHLKVTPGSLVSNNSGSILKPGSTNTKAADGHRYTPSLYIFPQTADANGKAYYPKFVRGNYNNGKSETSRNRDNVPSGSGKEQKYVLEYLWKIEDIGLTPGIYNVQFVIADAKGAHGVKCITLRVYDPPDTRFAIPN